MTNENFPTTHNPQPIRLLAADLDGTVLSATIGISPRVREAFRAAAEAGVWVTIATGRNVASARKFAQSLSVNAPLLCLQGGVIYDLATETAITELRLSHELACEMIDLGERHPHWQTVVYHLNATYITQFKFERGFYLDLLTDNMPVVVPDLCNVLDRTDPDKVLFVVAPDEAEEALAELRELVGERAVVVRSHEMFVEVNHLDAHKGAGLAKLAAHLGVARESVMAIGDQGNDVSMLDWAGVGVAMGNASDEAKRAADWVAPSISDDGAAAAIERFILARFSDT